MSSSTCSVTPPPGPEMVAQGQAPCNTTFQTIEQQARALLEWSRARMIGRQEPTDTEALAYLSASCRLALAAFSVAPPGSRERVTAEHLLSPLATLSAGSPAAAAPVAPQAVQMAAPCPEAQQATTTTVAPQLIPQLPQLVPGATVPGSPSVAPAAVVTAPVVVPIAQPTAAPMPEEARPVTSSVAKRPLETSPPQQTIQPSPTGPAAIAPAMLAPSLSVSSSISPVLDGSPVQIESSWESTAPKQKRRKRAKNPTTSTFFCHVCGTTETTEWRRGPDNCKSLCNACGLHFAKIVKKEQMMKARQSSFSILDLVDPTAMPETTVQ